MALAASLSLTNCTEKIEGPIAPATPAGIPFEISADISTKTTNDGLATKWATGDAINLFHAEAGAAGYVSDGEFKLDATRDGVFTGNLSSALAPSKSYDWYAIYPYNQALETPANNATTAKYFYVGGRSDTPAVQNGNNSTSHLVERYAPLWGKAANVPSNEKPSMIMQHLASVVKVKVTNTTEKPLTVNSVAFTSTEPIVGQFYIDVTGTAVEYTTGDGLFNSSTASLTVKGATPLANGESAVYYIPIKPHTVAKDATLKISVNGYEKPLTLPKDVTFTAGSIKTLAFDYNKVVVDYVTVPWTENFSRDLSLYTLSNSTKRDESYAKGSAPELMVKGSGSFSAKVKADAGNYVLTFKSNHADYLTVLSSDKNVTVTKESDTEYLLTVPEGGSTFTLTIKNTRTGEKDNARIDDINLDVRVPVITVDKTTVSAKPEGDKLTLKYSIKYPAADATITATSKETWVKGFDYKVLGEVSFVVDANEDEARTATVTLSYPGAAPVAVTVSQSAKGAVEPSVKTEEFTFSSFEVTDGVATINATNFTIELKKENANNPPAWNKNSGEARLYAGGSLKVISDKTIKKVELTYVLNAGGKNKVVPTINSVKGSKNAGIWDSAKKIWQDAGGDNTITMLTSGSAGNVGFTKIKVTYVE